MTTKVIEAGASEAAAAEAVKTAESNAAAATTAKNAERTRLTAILALPEAKERQAQAQYLATNTDLTVEQIKGALAAAPVVVAAVVAKDNGFKAVMAGTENPNLQAGGDAAVDPKSTEAVIARMQANYRAATGNKVVKS